MNKILLVFLLSFFLVYCDEKSGADFEFSPFETRVDSNVPDNIPTHAGTILVPASNPGGFRDTKQPCWLQILGQSVNQVTVSSSLFEGQLLFTRLHPQGDFYRSERGEEAYDLQLWGDNQPVSLTHRARARMNTYIEECHIPPK